MLRKKRDKGLHRECCWTNSEVCRSQSFLPRGWACWMPPGVRYRLLPLLKNKQVFFLAPTCPMINAPASAEMRRGRLCGKAVRVQKRKEVSGWTCTCVQPRCPTSEMPKGSGRGAELREGSPSRCCRNPLPRWMLDFCDGLWSARA